MPSYEKFNDTLGLHNISMNVIEKINAGFEEVSGSSKRNLKRSYFQHAVGVLENELPHDVIIRLMDDNGCCKANTARAKASAAFAKAHSDKTLEKRIPLIKGVKNMGIPSLTDDGRLYILAVQYYKDGEYRCPCPTINTNRKNEIPLSRTYCMCCAGHFRYHYQIMLGCELRLSRVDKSPLDSEGSEPCAFIFDIT